LSGGLYTDWVIDTAFTGETCLHNRIWCCQSIIKSSWFTAASGTCTIAVMAESNRLQTLNSGTTSAAATSIATAEISENSDVLDGGFWSYGNAGLVNPNFYRIVLKLSCPLSPLLYEPQPLISSTLNFGFERPREEKPSPRPPGPAKRSTTGIGLNFGISKPISCRDSFRVSPLTAGWAKLSFFFASSGPRRLRRASARVHQGSVPDDGQATEVPFNCSIPRA